MSTYSKSNFPKKLPEEDLPNVADEHHSPTYRFFVLKCQDQRKAVATVKN